MTHTTDSAQDGREIADDRCFEEGHGLRGPADAAEERHQQHTGRIGVVRNLLPRSKWLWRKTELFNANVSLGR